MLEQARTEKAVLDAIAPELVAQGYSVFIQPSASLLPTSFKGFRPDAVALSKDGNILIEVTTKSSNHTEKLKTLKALVDKEPGWSLRVLLAQSYERTPSIGATDDTHLDAALADAAALLNEGKTNAALLLAWAALEAAGRRLLGSASEERPLVSVSLLNAMAEGGLISHGEFTVLRRFSDLRNRIAHGDLALSVEKKDLRQLLEVIGNLRLRPEAA